jgi:hypothetical protein
MSQRWISREVFKIMGLSFIFYTAAKNWKLSVLIKEVFKKLITTTFSKLKGRCLQTSKNDRIVSFGAVIGIMRLSLP